MFNLLTRLSYASGTERGPLACDIQAILNGGCAPSVHQQSVGSHYLKAQNKRGATALVPTVALFTPEDGIVVPARINPSGALPGALSKSMKDLCGALHIDTHMTMPTSPGAFWLLAHTAARGGEPDYSQFDRKYCSWLTDGHKDMDWIGKRIENNLKQAYSTLSTFHTLLENKKPIPREPNLRKYVCDAGDATEYCLNA